MPLCKFSDLMSNLAPNARLMGLDPGTKTIGMAVCDAALSIASPIGTIRRSSVEADAVELRKAMEGRDIGALIIGLPVNMDGTEGPRAVATRALAERLTEYFDIPITFWDERLSTRAVERAMIGADMTRKKRAKKIDSAAAAYILQGAIDLLRAGGGASPGL